MVVLIGYVVFGGGIAALKYVESRGRTLTPRMLGISGLVMGAVLGAAYGLLASGASDRSEAIVRAGVLGSIAGAVTGAIFSRFGSRADE